MKHDIMATAAFYLLCFGGGYYVVTLLLSFQEAVR